jgi:Asp-tRNA(Asn)/Glu-tRNA(Gln) amidotransferase A subunit family amidase
MALKPEQQTSPRNSPENPLETAAPWSRRLVLKTLSAAGIGTAVFGRALLALAEESAKVTEEMVRQAEWIAGLDFTDEDRKLLIEDLNQTVAHYEEIRAIPIDNSVPPALRFATVESNDEHAARHDNQVEMTSRPAVNKPSSDKALAFSPLTELAELVRTKQISSVELTRFYLDRLHRYNPLLKCVISFTDELALQQAELADREIAAGNYRGPLHGIPWGAKDLLAVPGYRTTWGAKPYEEQDRGEEKAAVVQRLEDAGAVLVAKLTLGALAWGDVWYGGKTRNPWKPEQGSSGSSAGPGSATAAGLAGFTIGTETWGSIVSPSTRNGVSGLRPTYGRVSRAGAMALSWSMDKIGPMARSVEDCALIFGAIHGADGVDTSAVDRPFHWPLKRDPRKLRVAYLADLFEKDRTEDIEEESDKKAAREWQAIDLKTLDTLRDIGFDLKPLKLPDTYPVDALDFILSAEAAAAFDDLTRSGKDDLLVRQTRYAWPNVFRNAQLIPAVEYIRGNRIRTLIMRELEEALADVDVFVAPSFVGSHLLLTNLTGHPAVVVPNGFRPSDGTPTSITFTGRLFQETEVLAVAHTFQQATGFHRKHPPIEKFLQESKKAG